MTTTQQNTILQLRQAEANTVANKIDGTIQNGVYEIVLDSPITLQEFDTMNVKSVYLDTVEAGSGFIEIQNDLPLSMTFCIYVQNYNLDQNYDYLQPDAPGSATPVGVAPLRLYPNVPVGRTLNDKGDNQLWWLSTVQEVGGGVNVWTVSGIDVIPDQKHEGIAEFGGTTINFEYTPITPGAIPYSGKVSVKIKKHERRNYNKFNPYKFGVKCTGTAAAPDFRLTPEDNGITPRSHIKSVDWIPYSTESAAGQYEFVPQEFTMNVILPQGSYSPTELSQTINNLVTNAQFSGDVSDDYGVVGGFGTVPFAKNNWTVMNPFLTSVLKNENDLANLSADLTQCFVNASGNSVDNSGTILDNNGKYYMAYDTALMRSEYDQTSLRPPVDRYLGTNQVELSLDMNENKLKWETLHFPIYGNPSTPGANDAIPSVAYNATGSLPAAPDQEFIVNNGLATRYSGVAFTALSPPEFWSVNLGFSDCYIKPVYNANARYPTKDDPEGVNNSFSIDVQDGVQITGGFPSIDIGVLKNADTFSTPIYADGSTDNIISTSAVQSVYGTKVWNVALADEGYFIVRISNNFNQNLIGGALSTDTTTQSIVNRYYSLNSFTSDTGAGSITYQHRGSPEMISSLKVEILNPDGSFVPDTILQNKNTVFLEITRNIATQIAAATPPPEE